MKHSAEATFSSIASMSVCWSGIHGMKYSWNVYTKRWAGERGMEEKEYWFFISAALVWCEWAIQLFFVNGFQMLRCGENQNEEHNVKHLSKTWYFGLWWWLFPSIFKKKKKRKEFLLGLDLESLSWRRIIRQPKVFLSFQFVVTRKNENRTWIALTSPVVSSLIRSSAKCNWIVGK